MLKNVQDAKFAKTLVPISKVVLSPADQKDLSFDAFFTHILVHELMHGLGPHNITVGGRETTVRQEMKEASSLLEEAKADISGLFALQYLIDKGVLPKSMERTLYTTFLASCFRSIRFGINEAHGKGIAMQLNYLLDQGGVVRPDGTFAVDPVKIKEAVTGLTREIMTIQAEGDYAEAKALGDRLGVVRPPVQKRARPPLSRAGRHRAAVHDRRQLLRRKLFPRPLTRRAGSAGSAALRRCTADREATVPLGRTLRRVADLRRAGMTGGERPSAGRYPNGQAVRRIRHAILGGCFRPAEKVLAAAGSAPTSPIRCGGTSPSSPTSTTARPRSSTRCCTRAARSARTNASPSARWTTPISSASAASPFSRRTPPSTTTTC